MKLLSPWVTFNSTMVGVVVFGRFCGENCNWPTTILFTLSYVLSNALATFLLARLMFERDDKDRKICLAFAMSIYFMMTCLITKFTDWSGLMICQQFIVPVTLGFLILFEKWANIPPTEAELRAEAKEDFWYPPGN
ncbi:MAG: hypothetical protein NTW50_01125 [Candidatus Berkelbacteria bacterium]|nr:hypothetical protein [Candidatus Berkelbacteria bacterium]